MKTWYCTIPEQATLPIIATDRKSAKADYLTKMALPREAINLVVATPQPVYGNPPVPERYRNATRGWITVEEDASRQTVLANIARKQSGGIA